MATPKLADTTKLVAWIAVHEPALFRKLVTATQQLKRSPLGRLGYFGDDSGLEEFTPTATYMTDATVNVQADYPDFSVPTDSSVTDSVTNAINAPSSADTSIADSSSSGGGFWGSIGSSIGSIGSTIGSVAQALVSPPMLNAAANVASTYFKSQAQTAQSQQQAALVNAQFARVGQGVSPAPVTYVRNPATGQLQAVYASNQGYTPVTSSLYNRLLSPSSGTPTWMVPAMIGGGILLVLALAKAV